MPKCSRIKVSKRDVCIGDLNKQISIYERGQTSPTFGNVDYSEGFSLKLTTFAGVETKRGYSVFDQIGINQNQGQNQYTHIFYIRYVPECQITSQDWIEYNCDLFKIVNDVENLDENDEFLKIRAVKKGPFTKAANLA